MDNILEKIRKLLQLSNSSNEHEAAAAAELASSLALKYNIDLLEIQTSKIDYKENDIYNSTKIERWVSNIVSGLCLVNACKHYIAYQIDGSVKYRIVGRPTGIALVEELTTYLTNTIKRLQKEAIRSYTFDAPERAQYRKAFRLGASQRLYQRLKEQFDNFNRKDNTLTPTTNALVVSNYYEQERKNIEDYLQNAGLKDIKTRSIMLKSSFGYHDGIKAGSTVNLGDQIHGVRDCRQIR